MTNGYKYYQFTKMTSLVQGSFCQLPFTSDKDWLCSCVSPQREHQIKQQPSFTTGGKLRMARPITWVATYLTQLLLCVMPDMSTVQSLWSMWNTHSAQCDPATTDPPVTRFGACAWINKAFKACWAPAVASQPFGRVCSLFSDPSPGIPGYTLFVSGP